MIIRAVTSIIPGYGDTGRRFGKLVSVDELLSAMCVDANTASDIVEKRMGFSSVAFTNTSYATCSRLWESGLPRSKAFEISQSVHNVEIYAMLEHAIRRVIAGVAGGLFCRHLHIAPMQSVFGAFRLREVALKAGMAPVTGPLIIPEGCSGLLTAMSLARLVATEGLPVLITAESDMSIHSHQRVSRDCTLTNIDDWLWGAVFGEGVGAMVLDPDSAHSEETDGLRVESLFHDVVERDWRVRAIESVEDRVSEISVKARAVKRTYLQWVSANAEAAISEGGGIEAFDAVCLHESNPRIVAQVGDQLGVPRKKLVCFSDLVGSLSCVSAFSLLDDAINSRLGRTGKIATAVIGEAGGVIRAGRFAVSRNAGVRRGRVRAEAWDASQEAKLRSL